ncbi:PE family protein [Mycobacterium servetii]|uniref:PE family protein n=1 Tax=Mycobacterium servetii TaxID=3237418 RepID=A0ABV4BY42_9MYCO
MLIAVPESMTGAAADLATIASAVNVAHLAAAAPTVAMVPAAADAVSSTIAQLFSRYAQDYQALAARAASFHDQLVQRLTSSAGPYAGAEAANVAMLKPLTAGMGAAAAAGANWSTPFRPL